MEATKIVPPPQPVPPTTVTLTMSLDEARTLIEISEWNISVARLIASKGRGFAYDQVLDVIDAMRVALDKAGVR